MSGGATGGTLELRLQRHVVGLAMAGGTLTPPLERLLTDLTEAADALAALRAENARLAAVVHLLDPDLLDEMARAVEYGDRDMPDNIQIPLWLSGLASRVRALKGGAK